MKRSKLQLIIFFVCLAGGTKTFSQKQLYIPNDWKDPNQNIPWDSVNRCKKSANFAVFWGPLAGNDPTRSTNPAVQFNPQTILDSLEDIYNDYINKWKLLPDSGTLAQYKIVVVMNNTWRDGLYTGYLFGGGFDNVIGAMFIDPPVVASTDSWGLSHEFTHACQYMITYCLYPGHGFSDAHSGFFWETHAQFMAWQRLPANLGNADPARSLNFASYNMASARKHYANIFYVEMLAEKYGIDFIGRVWREADYANLHEHPFQTIQKLLGLDGNGMNKLFMEHAMRNVKWDYTKHDFIQHAMDALGPDFYWRPTNIPDSIGKDMYAIPNNLAPQQYGYNIIKLFTADTNCATPYVHIKFKGHEDNNASSGWLYGFVSLSNDSVVTYSNQYSDSEVTYKFPPDTKEYFLVVMGAPTTFHVHTGLFETGFPKEFRYAWQVRLQGMVPDGYQPGFINTNGIAGAPHANGGGFVAATAHVDATAYVGANAAVLDYAQVTGNARIEGKARVRQFAVVSGNAIIKDFADVYENAVVSDHAVISGQAKVFSTTISDSSTISDNAVTAYANISGGSKAFGNFFTYDGTMKNHDEFGGDAELFSECSNGGKYLQVDGLLQAPNASPRQFCDGSYDDELNIDTNKNYTYFGEATMAFGNKVDCGNIVGILGAPPVVDAGNDQQVTPGNTTATLTGTAVSASSTIIQTRWIDLTSNNIFINNSASLTTSISNLKEGVYLFKLIATDGDDNQASDTVQITVLHANASPLVDAGRDIIIKLPLNYITLNGKAADVDNNLQSVVWSQLAGPSNASIVNPNLYSCLMNNLMEGIYSFVFTGTDSYGIKASDTISVTVLKAGDSTVAISSNKNIITAFPNPAASMVTMLLPLTVGGELSMFNAEGEKIFTKQIAPGVTVYSFPVKQFSAGVYFVRFETYNNDTYKLKLMVMH